jgi:membrane associated rhomboid family serine protease
MLVFCDADVSAEEEPDSMLPIGDDNSSERTFPILTFALIALNVLFFFVELSGGDAFVKQWAFVPSRFLANPSADLPTLFTSMFMHGGWLHLGGNMLYLWIFGDNVEDRLGHATFTIFYFLCGIAATFAQLMVSPGSHVPNLGASGAIAGVLGSYILMFPQGRVRVLQGQQVVQMPALMVIGFWIVLQLFSGIGSISSAAEAGGVAYIAHVGWFVAGCVLTLVLGGRRQGVTA